ncbi:MAG TPA: serine protease [Gemmataceae bacterium]|jgi:S1-C subfamily serine protease|nr:serine protease [Gemmataceae bacterium]
MAGDFDFFNEEPKVKPAPKAPPPPPRTEPLDEDDFDEEPAPPPSRGRAPNRRDRYDEPEREERPRYGSRHDEPKKKMSPLVIVAIIVGGVLVLGGGIVGIVLAVGGGSKQTEPKDKGNSATTTSKPPLTSTKKEKDAPSDLNAPSAETVEKVKKATVKILVQFAGKKGGGSGSGFVEKESRLVLTNAHVVGMKKITDPPPLINLVCNSGVGEQEYRLGGEVLAVDAENDLAIIRPKILIPGERTPVPDGLVVPKTSTVTELQKLFVFGFPLGDALGSEISIRPTQVTSLRHESGKLKKIQVEGGMTFGNSGGPVVDVKGNVCGVAVSGIKDANINFCVPGEMVQQLLARYKSGKE